MYARLCAVVVLCEGIINDFVFLPKSARLDWCREEFLPDLDFISVPDEVLEKEKFGRRLLLSQEYGLVHDLLPFAVRVEGHDSDADSGVEGQLYIGPLIQGQEDRVCPSFELVVLGKDIHAEGCL